MNTNGSTTLSIIVPIYNTKMLLLKPCLDSLLRQSLDGVEFLLIDDGSTDASGEIAQSYLYDQRFKYYRKENGGSSSARNLGLKLSKGNFIAFVDSDDILHDDFSSHFYRIAIEGDADIVSGAKQMFDLNIEFGKLNDTYKQINSLDLVKIAYACWAKMYRRELFLNPVVLFPENVWAEDNGFTPYLAAKAEKILFVPSIVYGYRRTGLGSVSFSPRTLTDAPIAVNYLFSICTHRKILVYTAFTTMNNAILSLPYRKHERTAEIKKYITSNESKRLFLNLSKIIKLSDISFIIGRQKIYFLSIYFLSKNLTAFAFVFYQLNTFKNALTKAIT